MNDFIKEHYTLSKKYNCLKNTVAEEIKIGNVIKMLMYLRRLSLKELAEKSNVPYSSLYSWSENRPPKDIVKARRLADILKVTLDELFFGFELEKSVQISNEKTCDDDTIKGIFEIQIKRVE